MATKKMKIINKTPYKILKAISERDNQYYSKIKRKTGFTMSTVFKIISDFERLNFVSITKNGIYKLINMKVDGWSFLHALEDLKKMIGENDNNL